MFHSRDQSLLPAPSPPSSSPSSSLSSSPITPSASYSFETGDGAFWHGPAATAETEAALALCYMSSSPPEPRPAFGPPPPSEPSKLQVPEQTKPKETWLSRIQPPGPPKLFKTHHVVSEGRYSTAYDDRGYLPVFEYDMSGQQVMMIDAETSYVRFTGIWKALGHAKADLARMHEETPEIEPFVKKIRGGFLKIQGTWLPYEIAKELSRRVAYPVRHDLVPIFGPDFPKSCLKPGEDGYGYLLVGPVQKNQRKRPRAATTASATTIASTSPDSDSAATAPRRSSSARRGCSHSSTPSPALSRTSSSSSSSLAFSDEHDESFKPSSKRLRSQTDPKTGRISSALPTLLGAQRSLPFPVPSQRHATRAYPPTLGEARRSTTSDFRAWTPSSRDGPVDAPSCPWMPRTGRYGGAPPYDPSFR